ncbi:hypothetical protein A1O7_02431 [Cladophialophora yegresii CBS 114405]|uniref:Uncharacterized protein n=1 Tax=Cladophialophora yegresii CBS 114405 TaxID=1182544 RepID=W9WUL7_9EURO|nr:uncharacterized protein A1O7_02431 [Cladophialophora yegresii CBS 114405]EXJ61999.1 hypothetical protein A1O7_02431 [Cladophialophora yegresii CBS 114405]
MSTTTTTKRPSLFSRFSSRTSMLSTSPSSSSSSPTESSSSTPRGCRDYNRYAKHNKGHNFTLTDPYSGSSSSSSNVSSTQSDSTSTPTSTSADMPVGARDFKLRYAKDSKLQGHDFSKTYLYAYAATSTTNYSMALDARGDVDVVSSSSVPRGCRHLANKNMRYAWHQGRQVF